MTSAIVPLSRVGFKNLLAMCSILFPYFSWDKRDSKRSHCSTKVFEKIRMRQGRDRPVTSETDWQFSKIFRAWNDEETRCLIFIFGAEKIGWFDF
jgi:hypothetical protein